MMILKAAFKCVLFCAFPFALKAQKLILGQKIPEMEFSNILNYNADKLRISDFKGKLIILDFWNHYCTACIKSFPKLDSLQKAFKNDIQIILVNSESKDSTKRFFEKRPRIKRPDLIIITGDKKLSEMFPAEGYPYCVWIDSLGIVRRFSGSHAITAHSISSFFNGEEQNFIDPTKRRFGSPVNFTGFKYLSYISQCQDSLYIGNTEKVYADDSNYAHIASNCASVVELFKKAFGEKGKYNFDTPYGLVLEMKDSSEFTKPSYSELLDDWTLKHGYNYELYLPSSKAGHFYQIMQDDLKRYFSVEATVKEKNIKSVVLKIIDPARIKTKGGSVMNSFGGPGYGMQASDQYRYLRNQPYSLLSTYLRLWIQYYYPYYDKVQFPFNIDIRVREESVNPFNIDKLNEDLSKAGLKLVFEERPCLVLHLRQIQ